MDSSSEDDSSEWAPAQRLPFETYDVLVFPKRTAELSGFEAEVETRLLLVTVYVALGYQSGPLVSAGLLDGCPEKHF